MKSFATKGVPGFPDDTKLTQNTDGSLTASQSVTPEGTTATVVTTVTIPETADNFSTLVEEVDEEAAAGSEGAAQG